MALVLPEAPRGPDCIRFYWIRQSCFSQTALELFILITIRGILKENPYQ
jgi:hypothetical protein